MRLKVAIFQLAATNTLVNNFSRISLTQREDDSWHGIIKVSRESHSWNMKSNNKHNLNASVNSRSKVHHSPKSRDASFIEKEIEVIRLMSHWRIAFGFPLHCQQYAFRHLFKRLEKSCLCLFMNRNKYRQLWSNLMMMRWMAVEEERELLNCRAHISTSSSSASSCIIDTFLICVPSKKKKLLPIILKSFASFSKTHVHVRAELDVAAKKNVYMNTYYLCFEGKTKDQIKFANIRRDRIQYLRKYLDREIYTNKQQCFLSLKWATCCQFST